MYVIFYMPVESNYSESFLIDPNNLEELTYIAAKFGCTVEDVRKGIEVTRTLDRVEIYSWIVDYIFKVHYH